MVFHDFSGGVEGEVLFWLYLSLEMRLEFGLVLIFRKSSLTLLLDCI